MLRERCHPHQENLPAYSLGALDADEFAALESHLQTCEDCKAELADYRSIAAGLLHALPPRTPPARLRRNIVTQLHSASKRTPSMLPLFDGRFSLGQLVNAAILLILIGSNLFAAMQIRELRRGQAELTERLSAEQAAIGLLAYPNTQIRMIVPDVQNLTGSVLVDKERPVAVLFLWNLPRPDPAQSYQIWLINAQGERISAGFILPSEEGYTSTLIQSAVPLGEFIAIGVTVEPAGGSDQPTGDRLLVVEL
jgi:anti-sigma-K factor RskA